MIDSDPVVARLLDEHRQIEAASARLGRLLRDDHCVDVAAVGEARWELARLILRHLPVEERHVYRRIAAARDPAIACVGQRFSAHLAGIVERFHAHSERWTVDDIARDWTGYRSAALLMLAGLADRLRREEADLYPLLARVPPVDTARSAADRNWAREGETIRRWIARA